MTDAPILIRYHQPGDGARLGVLRGDTVHDVQSRLPHARRVLPRFLRRRPDSAIAAVADAADASSRRFPAADLNNAPAADVAGIGCRRWMSRRSGRPASPTSTAAKRARKKQPMAAMSTPASTPPSAPRSSSKPRPRTRSGTWTRPASAPIQAGMCPSRSWRWWSIRRWRCSASPSATT